MKPFLFSFAIVWPAKLTDKKVIKIGIIGSVTYCCPQ